MPWAQKSRFSKVYNEQFPAHLKIAKLILPLSDQKSAKYMEY
jgi:hypothetical protein